MVRAGAAHPARVPGVEQLRLGDRHEEVARLRQIALHPDLAVLDDLGVGRDPRGVAAAGAEPLAAGGTGDAIATRHHDRLRGRGRRVRHDGARHVDPDRARHRPRHPRRVGAEDGALIQAPAGARVGLADLLDHQDVGRQVDLAAADGARDRHVEQPGVRHRLEERARQLAPRLDLVGGGANLGHDLPCSVDQRAAVGGQGRELAG